MTMRTLIRRSLRFHWRTHLGVTLGAAIGSAALLGALVVGDSVRGTLRRIALDRISGVQLAMRTGDRFFEADLPDRLLSAASNAAVAHPETEVEWGRSPRSGWVLLEFRASVSAPDRAARANDVHLFATGPSFWRVLDAVRPGTVLVNRALAARLGVTNGDPVIVRFPKPSALSREAALTPRDHAEVVLRLTVDGILPDRPGNLALESGMAPPLNAFVSLHEVQEAANLRGRANLLLVSSVFRNAQPRPGDYLRHYLSEFKQTRRWPRGRLASVGHLAPDELALTHLQARLKEQWRLADAECELREVPQQPHVLELRTRRVFLDPPLVRAALAAAPDAKPVLTYLANLLRAGSNATPYSMVTAAGPPWTPPDMREDEILVTDWLAADLHVQPGDEIALVYFDPESGARLLERTNSFRVRGIVPMTLPWADRALMPDFPGIEKAESTRDWDAGFPLTYAIRQKDEDYWRQWRGTPKAFLTLAVGQKLWANRFGNATAIRFPSPPAESTTPPGKAESAQGTSPLPAGEGKGEGEATGQSRESGGLSTHDRPTLTPALSLREREQRAADSGVFGNPGPLAFKAALEGRILSQLEPAELGLRFEPVREQALRAARESQDFGGLFLGFSFFLIAAALVLMALLFRFGLEQRAPEIGTLLALGFTPVEVRRLLLREGAALAWLGGLLGALGGLGYAHLMLHGLNTVWREAVGGARLDFHVSAQSLVIGLLASTAVAVLTIRLALRRFVKLPARVLLAGELEHEESPRTVGAPPRGAQVIGRRRLTLYRATAGIALLAGVVVAGWALARGDAANSGAFFAAGALVLVAGLAAASAKLVQLTGIGVSPLPPGKGKGEGERAEASDESETAKTRGGSTLTPALSPREREQRAAREKPLSLTGLSVRGCARRLSRSVSTIAMLACGVFLITSIAVFRLDAGRDAWRRDSGTGGFALLGATTLPVMHDLNTRAGRDFFALRDEELAGVQVVALRVREGDEASCLNLNRAQRPRLLGVNPELLEGRFRFVKGEGWRALRRPAGDRSDQSDPPEIPAIGDANSIRWAMKKNVGDTLDYVDERGRPFRVRIVGAVANSVLQGALVIDEAEFVRRFPGTSGYRMFLIDAPSNRVARVAATLSRALEDAGLELVPSAERLAQFNAVQNTYLGTFQVLGGLGLLLGSAGLGIVVLRNALERRGELALLLAVGFRRRDVQRLLLMENGALLVAGLGVGLVAAAIAVLPAALGAAAPLPWASLAVTLAAVLANGLLWTWAATRLALRGNLLEALRNE